MPRVLMIVVLAGSVAAGMWLSRLLLPPERPAGEGPDPTAVQMRASVAQAETGDFSLPDLAGDTRTLADWDGELRVINFWATWCAPCRREIPLLKEIQAQHGEAGIQVIGIAVDDPEPVADYAAEMEFNYPVLIGQEDAIAAAESFGIDFLGLPFTLIVTPDGELLNVHVGEFDREQAGTMASILRDFLDGSLAANQAREALAGI
jgi:thiol-disulfide isomerase/thioredoxin